METLVKVTERRLVALGLATGAAALVVAAGSGRAQQLVDPASQTTAQLQMSTAIQNVCPNLSARADAPDRTQGEANLNATCTSLVQNTQQQDQQGINNSVQTVNGEEINSLTSEVAEVQGIQVSGIAARLDAIRSGLIAPGLSFAGLSVQSDGERYALDELDDYEIIPAQAAEGGIWDKLGVFITGGIKFGDKEATDTVDGYDFDTYGITVGADYRVSDTFVIGAAFGYSNYNVDFDDTPTSPDGQELDSNNILFSLFTTYYPIENFFIDGIANVGGSFYDSERRVVVPSNDPGAVPTIDDTAEGDFDAIPFGFAANVGYDFGFGSFTVTPIGRLEYLAASVDGFSEDPVQGGLALEYDDQYIDSLTFNIGATANYAISTDFGVIVPSVRAEMVNQLLDDPEGVQLQYANDPTGTSAFTARPDDIDSTYGVFGAGLTGQFAGGWAAFVDYTTVAGLENFDIHSVNLGLRKSF